MKIPSLLIASLLIGASSLGAAAKTSVLDVKKCLTDSTVIFPESFETDTQKLLEGWYMTNYTSYDADDSKRPDPGASEELIMKRLRDMPTVIDMPYNQVVRQCIERYTKKGRKMVSALLGLSNYYMPIFEQALEAKGLPLELKYLPVIESALDPNAVSRSGAAGLWQMMLVTGKGLGLEVNSLVDERRDPYLSSDKAASLLKDFYDTYGDWSLAIAAYNCGPGTVNKAIRRAGGDPKQHDFWSIYSYLPAETRGYVPMFIAANYVMTYYKEHDISPVLPTRPLVTDTVAVSERLNLHQISEVLDIPMEELRVLNPQFRADIIPGTASKMYTLVLPSQQIHAYILSQDKIREHDADKYARRIVADPGSAPDDTLLAEVTDDVIVAGDPAAEVKEIIENPADRKDKKADKKSDRKSTKVIGKPGEEILHSVKEGESLASIADLYGVKEEQIKSWNNMSRNAVRIGKKLRIVLPGGKTLASAKADEPAAAAKAPAQKKQQDLTAQQDNARKQAKASKNSKTQYAAQNTKKSKKNKKDKKTQTPKNTSYTVQSGDNLSKIAKKYGTTVDAIKKANGLKSDDIRDGKKLSIPSKQGAGKNKKKKSGKKRR